MKKKLIAGNWKMNGSLAVNEVLLKAMLAGVGRPGCQVAVCVPAVYLAQCQALLAGSVIELGAQDVSSHESGAYTGEISPAMLKEFGLRYVIVGHSERRQYHGETDELVAAKAQRALSTGITPIVCVGETLAEREAGHTEDVVKRQLAAVIHTNGHCISEVVVAYEPVWAIGTGDKQITKKDGSGRANDACFFLILTLDALVMTYFYPEKEARMITTPLKRCQAHLRSLLKEAPSGLGF